MLERGQRIVNPCRGGSLQEGATPGPPARGFGAPAAHSAVLLAACALRSSGWPASQAARSGCRLRLRALPWEDSGACLAGHVG